MRANRQRSILAVMPVYYEVRAMKSPRSTTVPKAMQTTYDAVVALTDTFCRDHLNDEYCDLARAMPRQSVASVQAP